MKHQTTGQKGFSLIELLIVVAIIGIIAAIGVPNLLASRKAANEGSAIAGMRTMISAESTYQSTIGEGRYASAADLAGRGLIDSQLGDSTVVKAGYKFNAAPEGTDSTQFYATALSDSVSAGSRNFYTNEAGVIYGSPLGTTPTRSSPGTPVRLAAAAAPTGATEGGGAGLSRPAFYVPVKKMEARPPASIFWPDSC